MSNIIKPDSAISVITNQTMSSLEIAKLACKTHKNVSRDIRNMLKELELDVLSFERTYIDGSNRKQSCFNLPKRECLILVSGYNIKMRAAIIDRWQELEKQATRLNKYPPHLRRYAVNIKNVPFRHFSVLVEMYLWFMQPLEEIGCELLDSMLPDGSFGRRFCGHLRTLGYDPDTFPTYNHYFENGKKVNPHAYPDELLLIAKNYFLDDWLPIHSPQYLTSRTEYENILRVLPKAMPYLNDTNFAVDSKAKLDAKVMTRTIAISRENQQGLF